MKRNMKRALSLLLACVMLFALSAGIFQASAASGSDLKVGDYVQFGSYNGSPILWRVIDVDSKNGPLLFSEKILTLKCFDAGEPVESLPQDYPNYGNNYWAASNIRDWLNSSDETVEWTMNEPGYAFVESGKNAYADEAGFLYNFTETERNNINEVTQNHALDMISKSVAEGGSELLIYNPNLGECLQNYDKVFYKSEKDKVFLLNLQQFHDYVYARGFEVGKYPTEAAVVQSDYKSDLLSSSKYWKYWLSTSRAEDNTSVRTVYFGNYVLDDQAYSGMNGIAPALYLKKTANLVSGSGVAGDPYVVEGGKSTFNDLAGVEWAAEAINMLADKGIVNGTGDGNFTPLASVSRADFVLMMMRALGITSEATRNFPDVPEDAYYYDAVGQAKIRQYVTGYEDGTFHPTAEITMEDMYVIAARALSANNGVSVKEVEGNLDYLKDGDQISDYARASISWLLDRGVITDWNGYISPKAVATRADCAYFIFQMSGQLL